MSKWQQRALDDPRFVPFKGDFNGNPADIGLVDLIAEDFRTQGGDFFSDGFWVLFWHRFGNWRMAIPRPFRAPMTLIYRIMFWLTSRATGILLPYTVRVGRRVRLDHFGGMILVAQWIGNDVTIRQNTTFGIARMNEPHDRPVIGDRVEIGAGAVILGAVRIGEDAIIGANAVVTSDLSPRVVAGGVPARVIAERPQSAGHRFSFPLSTRPDNEDDLKKDIHENEATDPRAVKAN